MQWPKARAGPVRNATGAREGAGRGAVSGGGCGLCVGRGLCEGKIFRELAELARRRPVGMLLGGKGGRRGAWILIILRPIHQI